MTDDERLQEIKYWIGAHSPDVPDAVIRGAEDLLAEVGRLRQERDYWREECRKRAELLARLETVSVDCDGTVFCPDCDSPEGHYGECELFYLKSMPEEPKP